MADKRKDQKARSAVMLVFSGFPGWMSGEQRHYMIHWILDQTAEVKTYLRQKGLAPLVEAWEQTAKRAEDGCPTL